MTGPTVKAVPDIHIALPPSGTDQGVLARLLILENTGPWSVFYDATKAKQSMQWMQLVINNRLANNPAQFMAPGAKTITDVITAPGQFAGFENYPTLSGGLATRLRDMIVIAENPRDKRSQAYADYLNLAINTAKAPPVADPTLGTPRSLGLLGWRTENSGSPGPNFAAYQSVARNTFYMELAPLPKPAHATPPAQHGHKTP